MDNERLDKLQIVADEYSHKFKEIAEQIVNKEVTDTDDGNKATIAMFTARDMALGAILKRREYTLTGVAIGVGGTLLGTGVTLGIRSLIKKRRNTKSEKLSIEELEDMGIKTFKPEVIETDKEKVVKNIKSRKNDKLSAIIDEITESEKGGKK